MFGSVLLEFAFGLGLLGLAVVSWIYLLRASRRPVPPVILRSELGGEITSIAEIALLAFGVAATIDAMTKVMS